MANVAASTATEKQPEYQEGNMTVSAKDNVLTAAIREQVAAGVATEGVVWWLDMIEAEQAQTVLDLFEQCIGRPPASIQELAASIQELELKANETSDR